MKKKELIIVIAVVTVIVLGMFAIHCSTYRVEADHSNLAEQTADRLNAGRQMPLDWNIKIHGHQDIGNKRITLIEIGEDLGRVWTERGPTGKYKVGRIGYGGGNFREEVVEDGDRKYYVFGGRNAYFGIKTVAVEFDKKEYILDVPEGDRFFLCIEIDPSTVDTHVNLDTLKFYDKAGVDITDQVPWN